MTIRNVVRMSDIPPEMFEMIDIYSRMFPVYIQSIYNSSINYSIIGCSYNPENDSLEVETKSGKQTIKAIRRNGSKIVMHYYNH